MVLTESSEILPKKYWKKFNQSFEYYLKESMEKLLEDPQIHKFLKLFWRDSRKSNKSNSEVISEGILARNTDRNLKEVPLEKFIEEFYKKLQEKF